MRNWRTSMVLFSAMRLQNRARARLPFSFRTDHQCLGMAPDGLCSSISSPILARMAPLIAPAVASTATAPHSPDAMRSGSFESMAGAGTDALGGYLRDGGSITPERLRNQE